MWILGVDITQDCLPSFKMLKKGSVQAVIFDSSSHQLILCANHNVFVQKYQTNFKGYANMRVPVKVLSVANIHVSLQFCGKAALNGHITLSYRASEASEEKIHFVPFFTKNINSSVNR